MTGLSKGESSRIKGVAILLMFMHHLYLSTDRFDGYDVSFAPFSENSVVQVAHCFKFCVSLFAFISGYGLFLSYQAAKQRTVASDTSAAVSTRWISSRLIKLITCFLFVYILSFICTFLIDGYPIDIYFSGSKTAGFVYIFIDAFGLANLFGTPTLCGTWWYMSPAILYIIFVPIITLLAKHTGWFATVVIAIAIPRLLHIDYTGGMNAWTFMIPMMLGMAAADLHLFERLNNLASIKLVKNKYPGTFSLFYTVLFAIIVYVSFRIFLNVDYQEFWEFELGFFPVFFVIFLKYSIISVPGVSAVLDFLGRHSMTMFLTHTFIRVTYLSDIVYSNGHFMLNFLVLLALSVILAVIIDWLKKVLHIDRIPALITNYITKAASKAQPSES